MWFYFSLSFAILSSIALVLDKKLMKNASPLLVIVGSYLVILPGMALFLYFSGGIPKVEGNFYLLMIGSAALDAVAAFASFSAIKIAPISLVAPIYSFNPLFTTIIAIFTLGEGITLLKICGILAIVTGSYVLNIEDAKKGFFAPIIDLIKNNGVRLALFASLLWAITPTLQKEALRLMQPQQPIYLSLIGLTVSTFIYIPFILPQSKKLGNFMKNNLGILVLLVPIAIVAQWVGLTAFTLTNVGYATAVFKLSTLFTIILGAVFFKEKNIKERFFGALIMVAGTILLVL